MNTLPKEIENIILDYKLDLEISEKVIKQKKEIINELHSYSNYDKSMKYVFLYIKLNKLFEIHLNKIKKMFDNDLN
jgi:hypothetical protein